MLSHHSKCTLYWTIFIYMLGDKGPWLEDWRFSTLKMKSFRWFNCSLFPLLLYISDMTQNSIIPWISVKAHMYVGIVRSENTVEAHQFRRNTFYWHFTVLETNIRACGSLKLTQITTAIFLDPALLQMPLHCKKKGLQIPGMSIWRTNQLMSNQMSKLLSQEIQLLVKAKQWSSALDKTQILDSFIKSYTYPCWHLNKTGMMKIISRNTNFRYVWTELLFLLLINRSSLPPVFMLG